LKLFPATCISATIAKDLRIFRRAESSITIELA
jgi:hypothetical protein